MTTFRPATADQMLAIRVNAGIDEIAQDQRFAAAEPDLVEAIVEGVGQFAAGDPVSAGRADIPGTYDCYFAASHRLLHETKDKISRRIA